MIGFEEKELGLITYLPSSYQEHARDEKGPLRALVKIFDYHFAGIIEIINRIETYFDPCTTLAVPDKSGRNFLSWLATWVCLALDDLWPEEKKRKLIKKSATLYKLRGTPIGLKSILEQFFDIEVEIREWIWPDGMVIGKRSTIGKETHLIENVDRNHCFMIILISAKSLTPKLIRKVRTVIDLEKPAHTKCYLQLEHLKKKLKE